MTLSTPIKLVALAGLALVLGLAGLLMLSRRSSSASPVVITPVHHAAAPATKTPAKAPVKAPKTVRLIAGLPVIVRRALEHRPAAVVVIYSAPNASDRAMLAAARAAARSAHAGFVAANVARDPIAAAVATWSPTVGVPGVLVVRRPGRIVFGVAGVTDRATIAQAVATAR